MKNYGIVHNMVTQHINLGEEPQSPIVFGDNQEFRLDGIHEEIGAKSGLVEEAVVFFRGAESAYALRVQRVASIEGAEYRREDRSVIAASIDPALMIALLQRNSSELLSFAELLPEED